MKRLLAALLFAATAAHASAPDAGCAARTDVTGLPLLEFPAARTDPNQHSLAIMFTGDGGWRRVDIQVTNPLRENGIPVIGFLTPSFYGTTRGPDESACALERTIRFYTARWKCDRVILIGYSRGADILPFMLNRLPPDVRASVSVVALLGLERMIDFRYHPSWIPFYHPKEPQFPVLPEMTTLRGYRVLCFYGEREKDSLCRVLDPSVVTIIRMPGFHHFAGRYGDIARSILDASREAITGTPPGS